jgi:DNA-binding NarL/FixJ family response regulator
MSTKHRSSVITGSTASARRWIKIGVADDHGLALALGPPSPTALRADTFSIGFDEYLVLSFAPSAGASSVHADGGLTRRAHLTSAEREVAELVVGGLSNQAIALHRKVSLRTVVNQVSSIYRKLAVRSRRELSALQRHGATGER